MKTISKCLYNHKKELEDMRDSLYLVTERLRDLLDLKYDLYDKAKYHARIKGEKIKGNIHDYMNEIDRDFYLKMMDEIKDLKNQKKAISYKSSLKSKLIDRMERKLNSSK